MGQSSVFAASDIILEGRDGARPISASAASNQQIAWCAADTVRRKNSGVRPDRGQGAPEHEAKKHDLPVVQQRRA